MKPKKITISQAYRLYLNATKAILKTNYDPSDPRSIWEIDGKLYSVSYQFTKNHVNKI